MLTLDGIVPSVVQTCILTAAKEVHICPFNFSVYCLHCSARQGCFSIKGPRKAATLHSIFDPSPCCSATDIMRDCGEKRLVPVKALGGKSKQQLPLSPLWTPLRDSVHVTLTPLSISWLRGEISARYEKEGATKQSAQPEPL